MQVFIDTLVTIFVNHGLTIVIKSDQISSSTKNSTEHSIDSKPHNAPLHHEIESSSHASLVACLEMPSTSNFEHPRCDWKAKTSSHENVFHPQCFRWIVATSGRSHNAQQSQTHTTTAGEFSLKVTHPSLISFFILTPSTFSPPHKSRAKSFSALLVFLENVNRHRRTQTHTHNDGGIFRKTRRFFKRPGLVSGARSVFVDSFFISTTAHYRRVKHGLSFASKALMLIYRKSLFLRLNRSSPTT